MFQYDVACRVSEPQVSAKFHGLVLFGLRVTRVEEEEKKKKMKNFGAYGIIGIFYLTAFRIYVIFWSVV